MFDKISFVIIIIICLISIYIFTNGNETFDTNIFFKQIPNIFLADNYYNYELNKPNIKPNIGTIDDITFDTYLYSKPTTQKIICSAHANSADCWEDNVNNCQWVHMIDGGSYCKVGQNIWP